MPSLRINLSPVLTLWDAIVAERLGSPWESALTVGQAVAGRMIRRGQWRVPLGCVPGSLAAALYR